MIDKGEYYQWYQPGYTEQSCRAYKEKVMGTLMTNGGGRLSII